MPHDYDVAIVGGGPAGLSAGLFLTQLRPDLRGRVVVIERSAYPRDKPCAGAIGARAERALARIGVVVDVASSPVRGISVALARGVVARTEAAIGRVVRRIDFDARLAELTRSRGIVVREGVRATSVRFEPNAAIVLTDCGELRARVVVGADGVESVVRRAIGATRGLWRAQVLEVDTEQTPSDAPRDLLHFDFTDRNFAGYAWSFPTMVDGRALVCRGVYRLLAPGARSTPNDLDARLTRQLVRAGLDPSQGRKKRYAERGFARREILSQPRALLIGEAAGVDPISGEGIAQAILYGEVLAPYLAARLDRDDLSFRDWKAHLARSLLGIDLCFRDSLCRRLFGPARSVYEEALFEDPRLLALSIRYFGGLPIAPAELARLCVSIGARLWHNRALAPLRAPSSCAPHAVDQSDVAG